MDNDNLIEKMKREMDVDIIHCDRYINECVIHLEDDHVNEIGQILDELDPSVPTLIVRKNPDDWHEEAVILTPKILEFMKSVDPDYLDYDLFVNYEIRHGKFSDIDFDSDNETSLSTDLPYLTEDEFIESEQKSIDYEPTESDIEFGESILNAVKDFHNMKWHNGEKFWK